MSLQLSGLTPHPGAHPYAFAKLAKDVALGYSALFACYDSSAKRIELRFVFLFSLIQRPQASTEHFAGVCVMATLDSAFNEFI